MESALSDLPRSALERATGSAVIEGNRLELQFDGATTFDRVIEFCDGWMPIVRGGGLDEKIETLRRRAKEAGRDPESIPVTVFSAAPERDAVAKLEQAGVERVIFSLPPAGRDVVEPLIDRMAQLSR